MGSMGEEQTEVPEGLRAEHHGWQLGMWGENFSSSVREGRKRRLPRLSSSSILLKPLPPLSIKAGGLDAGLRSGV